LKKCENQNGHKLRSS